MAAGAFFYIVSTSSVSLGRTTNMHMSYSSLISSILLLVAITCNVAVAQTTAEAGDTTKPLTTALGYDYYLHKDGGAEKAKAGNFVYFDVVVRTADSIINKSVDTGNQPLLQIPPDTIDRKLTPIEDVVRLLGVGDSVTVPIRVDTIANLPPQLVGVDYVYYDLIIQKILTEEAYEAQLAEEQAEQMQAMQAVQGRSAEVVAFADSIRQMYVDSTLENQLQTTESGLRYLIHEPGTGKAATIGKGVTVQYVGMLLDGTVFDQSFERGRGISFPLGAGRVISGWDEGIALLNEGAKATLFIPANLAYGESGAPPTIPGNSELVFYVELESVQGGGE